MTKVVTARPIVWDHQTGGGKYQPWQEWTESSYGFHIEFRPEDDAELPYQASWGEGDAESFATVDEAKQWCQDHINAWMAANALIVDAPVEASRHR